MSHTTPWLADFGARMHNAACKKRKVMLGSVTGNDVKGCRLAVSLIYMRVVHRLASILARQVFWTMTGRGTTCVTRLILVSWPDLFYLRYTQGPAIRRHLPGSLCESSVV